MEKENVLCEEWLGWLVRLREARVAHLRDEKDPHP